MRSTQPPDDRFGLLLPFDQALPDDICRRRARGNRKSEAANERVAPVKASLREQIRLQIASKGFYGVTINELRLWDPNWRDNEGRVVGRFKPANELSPRLTELKATHQIFDSGRERHGCTVYVSDPRHVNGSTEAQA